MVELPVKLYVQGLAKEAKAAVKPYSQVSASTRRAALDQLLRAFQDAEDAILEANKQDLDRLSTEVDRQLYRQQVERVRVTRDDLDAMGSWFQTVCDAPDIVGEFSSMWQTEDGMQVGRMRMPIGVIAVISDQGPRVAVEAFAMCLKTGNVCIYRGGTEWFQTNSAIAACLRQAAQAAGLPDHVITFVDRTEPEAALELVKLVKHVDAVVPRGKTKLRRGILEQSRVPVIGYDGGVSTIYVDGDADIPLAQMIVVNGKVQDAEASNAVDVVLIHQQVARHVLPGLLRRLLEEFKVELFGCPKAVSMMGLMAMTGHLGIRDAKAQDWHEKHQALAMGIKIVKDADEALEHIEQHGSGHTATIVTRDYSTAMRFVHEVDAGAVMVNASTRLHDGSSLGLGPEVGMHTTHVHTRGPVTLEALTCEKFVALGTGQVRHPHPVPQTYQDAMMLSSKF